MAQFLRRCRSGSKRKVRKSQDSAGHLLFYVVLEQLPVKINPSTRQRQHRPAKRFEVVYRLSAFRFLVNYPATAPQRRRRVYCSQGEIAVIRKNRGGMFPFMSSKRNRTTGRSLGRLSTRDDVKLAIMEFVRFLRCIYFATARRGARCATTPSKIHQPPDDRLRFPVLHSRCRYPTHQ